MKSTQEHYVTLRAARPETRDGEAAAMTIEEIAERLICSRQNVRLLLKQWEALGYLRWVPGRGRGHVSQITFLRSVDEILLEAALELLQKGQGPEAMAAMRQMPPAMQAQFLERLSATLGLVEETVGERQIDVLRYVLGSGYDRLDPAELFFAKDTNIVTQLFDGLVRLNPETGEIQPHLVHRLEQSADGRLWRLQLRKGVLFHHGRELNGQDVVATLRRLAASPFAWIVRDVEEVRAIGATMVEVVLREPNELFPDLLAAPPAVIVPQEADTLLRETFSRLPVGTGAFRVVINEPRQFMLEAHPHYFQGRAFLDRVDTWIVSTEEQEALRSATFNLRIASREEMPEHGWGSSELGMRMVQYLTMNVSKPGPLQRPDVRAAVRAALDPERMVRELGGLRARAAYGFLGRKAPQEPVRECVGQGEALRLYSFMGKNGREDAAWIQARLQEAGFEAEVHAIQKTALFDHSLYADADLVLKADRIDRNEAFSFLKIFWSDHSVVRNCLGTRFAELEPELVRITREPSPSTRAEMMAGVEEQDIVLTLYEERYMALFEPYVQGVSPHAVGMLDLRDIWFKR